MNAWRSCLFVRGDNERLIQRAHERGADAIILDLEDGVPIDRKPLARRSLPQAIRHLAGHGCDIIVRINASWTDAFADLEVASDPLVSAIMLPKVEQAGRLEAMADLVSELANRRGRACPAIIALIESAAGVGRALELASHPALRALAFGSEDYALSLGAPPSPQLLAPACSAVAIAAASRGIQSLGTPVSIAIVADDRAWASGVSDARAVGMTGSLCIHPRQVAIANSIFTPASEEIALAEKVVKAWAQRGSAGAIECDGRMIDRPVVLAAERTLARRNLGRPIA